MPRSYHNRHGQAVTRLHRPGIFHYHILPKLIATIKMIDSEAEVFIAFETASSMPRMHREYMRDCIGMPSPSQFNIDTEDFFIMCRYRIFLTSAVFVGLAVPEQHLMLRARRRL